MSCAALRAAGCSIAAATRAQRGPREWTPKRRRHSRGPRSAGGCPRIAWPLELCSDLLFARTRVKSIGNRWCLESVPNVAGDRHPGCALKSAGGPEDAAARNSSGVAENGVSAAANARNRAVRSRYSKSLRRICGGCQAAESRIDTEIRGPTPNRNPGDRSIGRLPPFIAVGLCARYGAASSACAVCASPVRVLPSVECLAAGQRLRLEADLVVEGVARRCSLLTAPRRWVALARRLESNRGGAQRCARPTEATSQCSR